MKVGLRINGEKELRAKFANVAECAVAGTLTRRGMTDGARIVTRTQKNMAPVRKGRILKKKLKGRLSRGIEVGKATRLSSVAVKKFRSLPAEVSGPRRLIKPGLVRRSIGFRVQRKDGNFVSKMGMNVGKKRSHQNFAPHAAFVGAGTKQRYSNKFNDMIGPQRANRGIMPKNRFIADATNVAAVAAINALDKAVREDTVRAFNMSLRASRSVEGVYA